MKSFNVTQYCFFSSENRENAILRFKKGIVMALSVLFLLLFLSCTINDSQRDNVYICTGYSSIRYHKSPNCKGLYNCNAEIRRVSLKRAKSMSRTPCKICY